MFSLVCNFPLFQVTLYLKQFSELYFVFFSTEYFRYKGGSPAFIFLLTYKS